MKLTKGWYYILALAVGLIILNTILAYGWNKNSFSLALASINSDDFFSWLIIHNGILISTFVVALRKPSSPKV